MYTVSHPGPVIEPESATPVYVQVADLYERRIRLGNPPVDRPIPAEVRIAAEFGIARGTARRAVDVLVERGLVVRVHGRGTYVVPVLPP